MSFLHQFAKKTGQNERAGIFIKRRFVQNLGLAKARIFYGTSLERIIRV
jgi:hypothetical protein